MIVGAPLSQPPSERQQKAIREESRFLKASQSVAYIEIILITLILVGIDLASGPLDGFAGVNPNPYWALVILISVQYGVFEGLVSAFLATLVSTGSSIATQFLVDVDANGWQAAINEVTAGNFTTFSNEDYLVAWKYAAEPLLWVVSALCIGLLRERLRQRNQELAADLKDTREREALLTTSYEQLLRTKEQLEVRVAGQLRTVFTLYQAAKAIEKLGPGEVLLGIADLVRAVMQPTKFSVFLLNGAVLEAVLNDGWEESDTYQRIFDSTSPIFQEVVGRQRFLSAVNTLEERLLEGEGILCGPLTSVDTGEVVGMLKIEQLGFLDLHVSSLENFRILSDWVGTAFANARRFRKAQGNMFMNDERSLMTDAVFKQQSRFMKMLGEHLGIDVTSVIIKATGIDVLHDDRRQAVIKAIRDVVSSHMSPMVTAYEHRHTGREFALIVPGVNAETDGEAVAAQFQKAANWYLAKAGIEEVELTASSKSIWSVPATPAPEVRAGAQAARS
ncbi:MAG: GAF domain-containing protein [Pseudomonadota bacterium]|nr:GAF domain-containing protein [Pseudomonadota bacterium]